MDEELKKPAEAAQSKAGADPDLSIERSIVVGGIHAKCSLRPSYTYVDGAGSIWCSLDAIMTVEFSQNVISESNFHRRNISFENIKNVQYRALKT